MKQKLQAPLQSSNKKMAEPASLFETLPSSRVGGAVASWLARSTLERALRVRALAGDIVLCSWARHFTLMVPLSTQVYKWVPANNAGGNPAMD